jgi:hypothetical protein
VLAFDSVRSAILVAQLANGAGIDFSPASEHADESPDPKKIARVNEPRALALARTAARYNRCMEPAARSRCTGAMKALAIAGIAALVLCGVASAKFRISVAASDVTPGVGQRVTVVVRSEQRLDYNLRLIAVAPGKDIFRVVATITGDTSYPDPNVARNGFEVPLVRVAPDRWRGTVRFRRTGRWRLVVPNGAPVGVVIPAGVARLTLAVH